MAGLKISELTELTTPDGDGELVYAKNGSNGKVKMQNVPAPFSSWVNYCRSISSARLFTKQAGSAVSSSSNQWTANYPGYFTKAVSNISTPYYLYIYINGTVVFDGYVTNNNSTQVSLAGISFKKGDTLMIVYGNSSYTCTVYGYEFY